MIWKEDRPESERPADDAERWIYWIQGGVPIVRMKLIKKEDGGDGEWSLGKYEYAFFGKAGSVELCYWLWARDKAEVTDRYKKRANELAGELERAAAMLREAGK